MTAKPTQDQIVARLIQTAPVELKVGAIDRKETNGPDLAFFNIGCVPCKTRWIPILFVQGQESNWEREAQARLQQHLTQFHSQHRGYNDAS